MNWIDTTRSLLRRAAVPLRFGRSEGGRSDTGRSDTGPPPPTVGEVAWADGLFFGKVPMERWNPDELIWSRGYDIYRRMMHDDQVRALVSLKQAVIAGRAWRFDVRQPDDSRHVQCAAFLRHMLEHQLTGSFKQALGDMLTSQIYGFSLIEKVHAPVFWEGRTLWGVERLKLRPAASFSFVSDAHGNLTELRQHQGVREVALPPQRFLHHVSRPDVHPHYGESELRACHRHWWAKENILKFWNIYLERMAAGFVHGRISGPLSPAERDELKQVLQHLSTQTSVITPGNVELEMVTSPDTQAFERAVAVRDKAIAKALLVPNLLGFSEQGQVGSYSQSRTQLETFLLALNSIADSVADALNEQLFRELAWWNFGISDAPRFCFDPLTDAQKREFAQAWQGAVAGGTVASTPRDEEHLRDLLSFPPMLSH